VKQRFAVDYIIEKRTTNEWFIVRFCWNIFLILEKTCPADVIWSTNTREMNCSNKTSIRIFWLLGSQIIRIHIDAHHIANKIFVSAAGFYSNAVLCSITGMCALLTIKNHAHIDSTPPVACRFLPSTPREQSKKPFVWSFALSFITVRRLTKNRRWKWASM
jgi:hypothetical protein